MNRERGGSVEIWEERRKGGQRVRDLLQFGIKSPEKAVRCVLQTDIVRNLIFIS